MSFVDKNIKQVNEKGNNLFQNDFLNIISFEYNIKNIFNHEFKESFENILLVKKQNFLNSVKQRVFSILTTRYTNKLFENQNLMQIISKYIEKLNNKYDSYYQPLSDQFNIFQNEKEKFKKNKYIDLNKYYFSSYRKHCSNSTNCALHLCNQKSKYKNTGKLVKIKNNIKIDKVDYLVCENCQKTYFAECFKCYCQFCQEVYYSNQLNKYEKKDLLPATLKNNHCEAIINDFIYCPLCKKTLYLNLINNKLQCTNERCKNNIIPEKTEWKCKTCSKYFTSDYKVYNPLEIRVLTDAINYSLCIKIKAKPNKLPCCTSIDLNTTDFYHSKKCEGLIYFGEYNQQKFIVCEKCKAINFHEKFIWTCPHCTCRFREVKDNDKDKEKEKEKDKENNELMSNTARLRYNKNNFRDRLKRLDTNHYSSNKKENECIYDTTDKRKRIFSQEYDYDNDTYTKRFNYNDENCDINILRSECNKKNHMSILNEQNSFRINNFDYKKSRNKRPILNKRNLSNNNLLKKDSKNENSSNRDSSFNDLKHKYRKRAISNFTSSNFYSEKDKNKNEILNKDNSIKKLRKKLITEDKKYNNSIEEKKKKNNIPHSKYIKRDISHNNRVKNLLENKSLNEELKKNYTPNFFKYQKKIIKNDKNNISSIGTISKNSIDNEKSICINNRIKNRSPYMLRRILNFNLTSSTIGEDKKDENKNENKRSGNLNINKCNTKQNNILDYIKLGKKKNINYYRFISSENVQKNIKHKKDNSISFNSSIRSCFFSTESNIKNNKNTNSKKDNLYKMSQRNSKNIKNMISSKNDKCKSADKEKGKNKKDKEKILFKYNLKYKYRSRIKKEEISLKPKDIIESSMVDLSKDIPIENESIKKNVKLYQHIQRRLKKILSKGKLPQFILENYTVIKQLGEGSFGAIFEVTNNETKIRYAMKKIIANNINSLEFFQKEFEIVHENSHPNILDIHGVCVRCLDTTTYVLYVLMDIAEKDWEVEINDRAKIKKYYSERELISMLKQIVNALCFLQKEKNVAHRDIKPENILLFKNNVCKIADFGEAKKSKENRFKTLRGTEFYMSPILYNNLKEKRDYVRHNSYKSDVFSLGYCLVCAASLDFDIIEKIRERNVLEIKKVFNHYFPKIYSKKFVDLIFKMIAYDEDKRVDFIQLKEILCREF